MTTASTWSSEFVRAAPILTRQLLVTAEFADTSDLAGVVTDYVTDYNTRAKPFNWTWNAKAPTPSSNLASARDH